MLDSLSFLIQYLKSPERKLVRVATHACGMLARLGASHLGVESRLDLVDQSLSACEHGRGTRFSDPLHPVNDASRDGRSGTS